MIKILNKNILLLLFPLLSFFGSAFQGQFVYDGFHLSIPIVEAKRYFNNEIPFKEFLIHYGFLKTFIDSYLLKVSSFQIYSLFLIYSFIYSFSIFLITVITKKISSLNLALLVGCCVYLIHPYMIQPWHNYFLFLLILLFLYFKLFYNYAFQYLFLGLGCLISIESFFFISLIIFIYSISSDFFFEKKKSLFFFQGLFYFFLPIFFFFIYILFNNLFYDFIESNKTVRVVLNTYEFNYLEILYFFFLNIFNFNFKNLLIIQPYNLVFLILFIFNILYFFFIIKKKSKIALISFIALCMCYNTFHNYKLYKLSTGLIIGIIPFAFFLNTLKDINNKIIISFLFFLVSLNSRNFFKDDTNPNFVFNYKTEINIINDKFVYFNYLKWNKEQWKLYEEFTEKILLLKKNCNIEAFNNLTSNGFFTLLAYDHLKINQKLLWFEILNYEPNLNNLFYNFLKNYDSYLIDNINKNLDRLLVITTSNNYPDLNYKDLNLNFAGKFKVMKFSSYYGRNIIFLYPEKCNL